MILFFIAILISRLNTNNLVEPVTQGLDLQLQEPFLLYRNSRCNIYGIWFYDKEECVRIGAMLNKLVKESDETRKACSKPAINVKNSGPNVNNVDIFSMLSKAQEDFNVNRSNSSGGGGTGEGVGTKSPLVAPMTDNVCGPLAVPLGPDVTSQSVMDFFAKAKVSIYVRLDFSYFPYWKLYFGQWYLGYHNFQVNTGHFKTGDQPTSGGTVAIESKPLLARLMSHPAAHTVEHIEKQHRSITPQPSTQQQSQATPTAILTANNISSASASNRSKRRSKTVSQQDSMISTPVSVNQEVTPSVNQNATDTNGTSGFLRIQSPINVSSNSTNHKASDIIGSSNSNPLASLFAHASATTVSGGVSVD